MWIFGSLIFRVLFAKDKIMWECMYWNSILQYICW